MPAVFTWRACDFAAVPTAGLSSARALRRASFSLSCASIVACKDAAALWASAHRSQRQSGHSAKLLYRADVAQSVRRTSRVLSGYQPAGPLTRRECSARRLFPGGTVRSELECLQGARSVGVTCLPLCECGARALPFRLMRGELAVPSRGFDDLCDLDSASASAFCSACFSSS